MNKTKDSVANQVNYLGRWVSKDHFRVHVHGADGQKKLANSYDEFTNLIGTGNWHVEKPVKAEKPDKVGRKPKNGSNS